MLKLRTMIEVNALSNGSKAQSYGESTHIKFQPVHQRGRMEVAVLATVRSEGLITQQEHLARALIL